MPREKPLDFGGNPDTLQGYGSIGSAILHMGGYISRRLINSNNFATS